jgi:hypothetical protein
MDVGGRGCVVTLTWWWYQQEDYSMFRAAAACPSPIRAPVQSKPASPRAAGQLRLKQHTSCAARVARHPNLVASGPGRC